MLAVGLTGGIGSGKTTVAEIFSVLGIPVFDADSQAKALMEKDELRIAITRQFGNHVYVDGKLDRKALANIVFADHYLLDKLNAIVHPVTIAAAKNWINLQTTPYAVKEAALLFESGSATSLDVIIGVKAPRELRIKRVMQRDGISRQQVIDRMNRQIDEGIKMKLCNYVLTNDEQQLLITQVIDLHHTLLALSTNANISKVNNSVEHK